MSMNNELRAQIEKTIASNRVVLFMKGTPQQPQCGFSATVIGILDKLVSDYDTVNVLEDATIREGVKEYSNWPTIPQLFVSNKFVGGCDIVQHMFNSGELHTMFGLESPEQILPKITISNTATKAIRGAIEHQPGIAVHLNIDAKWHHEFTLGPAKEHEIAVESNGVEILFDLDSAQRAHGLSIDMTESSQGMGFSMDNPNAPPPIAQISAQDLKAKLDAGEHLHLFDVRDPDERVRAHIDGSRLLDDEVIDFIGTLPKDAMLVFHCHSGARSQSAADNFRLQGYTNVHNLVGGIDAWSQEVDASVPRY